ncbi:hypothetical protein MHAS_02614 [Mycolicibacterium hassiacum DSM 44199]|nr:membrane protein [Mycolicibacterium hassiacum DSM 44199]VCT90905.1 hypothetical protein MHAS_02614 [Mycolicibacterium hassiacum DSM 44199]
MIGARRAAWWAAVVVMAIAIPVAAGIGIWRIAQSPRVDPVPDATARQEAVEFATSAMVTMLSYTHDKVGEQLASALPLLTDNFRNEYEGSIRDRIVADARERRVSTTANVVGAGVESISADRAVVIAFVDQSVVVGSDKPTIQRSSVRIELQRVDGDWLIDDLKLL